VKKLLLVSIGPIQDFIASARRCQDLWFGSNLLSRVAKAAAQAIRAQGGATLVFPGDIDHDDDVANKILALLPPGIDPQSAAQAAQEAMLDQLMGDAAAAFDRVEPKYFHRDRAMAQVKDLLEFVWVAVPLPDGGYVSARKRAEALLAQRKNTRTWQQVSWGAPVPKSSLDGMRESVIDEAAYDFYREKPDKLREKYFVKPAERLCGVGLLKRLGRAEEEQRFHSTGHIAAGPILAAIERNGAACDGLVTAYINAIDCLKTRDLRLAPKIYGRQYQAQAHNPFAEHEPLSYPQGLYSLDDDARTFDASLLMPSRLPTLFGEFWGSGPENADSLSDPGNADRFKASKLKAAQDALRRLLSAAGAGAEPCPYYAILLADGDHMGKAIEELTSAEAHQSFSSELSKFAQSCRTLIRDHGGSPIYVGGDDILALLPLHTALRCARALNAAFAAAMQPLCAKLTLQPTLSAGLGVSHFLEPMANALDTARAAEKLAKVRRDSLAIMVDKRSGGRLEVAGHWNETWPLDARIDDWCRRYHSGALPHAAAFELEQAVAPFSVDTKDLATTDVAEFNEVIAALTRRVLARRRSQRGEAEFDGALAERISARIRTDSLATALEQVQAIAHELQIARTFLDAYHTAWGSHS